MPILKANVLPETREPRTGVDLLERTRLELNWKSAFLEAQMNSSLDGILIVDPQGRKLLQNPRMAELLKIPPDIADDPNAERQLRSIANFAKHPDQFSKTIAYLSSHPNGVSREELELKDGTTLDQYSAPVVGEDGCYYGRIWTFRDITERKQIKEAVRDSEERFSGAFEHAPVGVALVSPDGRFLKINQWFCDLVGYSKTELFARTFEDITYPDDLPANLEYSSQLIAGAIDSFQMEKRYVHARGHVITTMLSVALVRDARNQPHFFIAQIQDITEHKQHEAEQKSREERYLRQRDALIAFTSEESRHDEDLLATLQRLTETAAKTLGVARASVWRYNPDHTAIRCLDLYEADTTQHSSGIELSADAYPAYFQALRKRDVIAANDAPRDPATMEFSENYLAPLGITSMLDAPIHFAGEAAGVLCHEHTGPPREWTPDEEAFAIAMANLASLALEETERRWTADALRAREAEFRTLAEALPQIVWVVRPDGLPYHVNQRWTDYTGLALEEIGTGWLACFHPDDQPRTVERWQEANASGEPYEIEYRLRRADGVYRWMLGRASPLSDAGGKIVKWFGTCTDIHDLKQAELEISRANAELRESEEKFRQLAENIQDVFYVASADLQHMHYINPAYEHVWGRSVESLYAHPRQWADAIVPEDRERVWTALSGLSKEQPSTSMEYRIAHTDGSVRSISTRAFQVRDAEGNVIRIAGSCRDVTKRARAEAEVLESKRFLQSALDALSAHIAILDEHGTILEVNAAWARFAQENDCKGRCCGVGGNYLDVCDSASGTFSEDAVTVAAGIRAVMAGQSEEYQLEYPCHSPWEKHWFTVRVTRFRGHGPVRIVVAHENITARKKSEKALQESNEKFHQFADNITDAFWIGSADMTEVQYVSPAFERIWGRSVESMYANPRQWTDFIVAEDRERVMGAFAALTDDVSNLDLEYRIARPDGAIRWVRVRVFQIRDDEGNLIRHTGIVTDITDEKLFEARLFESQKLETVGKLAGGVAHEFNSIMTAIIGQSEMLLDDLPPESPSRQKANEIHTAADRAAALTRQLLAYGRKQILQPETLDLNTVLAGMESTIRHLMGPEVDVRLAPAESLQAVKADAGQIEQVIMNMVLNARDSMSRRGKLLLETANISLDEGSVGNYPELKRGEYVMLAITDTGAGMNEHVKTHLFEPFFTTKGVGEGTGLGLSTCYGIIRQSGGHISVYSEEGRGATFKIYLPQIEEAVKPAFSRLQAPNLPGGTERIMLVDDDPALLEMSATLLRRLGYTVFELADGVEALERLQQADSGAIDLLFTDVAMPHMSGRDLADRVGKLCPHTRILFTSAYTENAVAHQSLLEKGAGLLQKPFTPSAMAHKLREVLDQPEPHKPDPVAFSE